MPAVRLVWVVYIKADIGLWRCQIRRNPIRLFMVILNSALPPLSLQNIQTCHLTTRNTLWYTSGKYFSSELKIFVMGWACKLILFFVQGMIVLLSLKYFLYLNYFLWWLWSVECWLLTVCLYVSPDFVLPYQETGSDESSSLFVSDNLHSQEQRGGGRGGKTSNNKYLYKTNLLS